MSSLNEEKSRRENEILRTSKYYLNDKIGGTFLMPIISGADLVKVVVPVNGKENNFIFKQIAN